MTSNTKVPFKLFVWQTIILSMLRCPATQEYMFFYARVILGKAWQKFRELETLK